MNILHVGSKQIDVELYIQRRLHLKTIIKKTVKIKIQNFKIQIWRCIYHVGYGAPTDVIYTTHHVSFLYKSTLCMVLKVE